MPPSHKVWFAAFAAVIHPRDDIEAVLRVNNAPRLESTIFFKNGHLACWAVQIFNKEMQQPEENSRAVKECRVEATPWKQNGWLRWVDPKARWRQYTIVSEWGWHRELSFLFHGDEGLHNLSEVTIQPIRHVFRLLEPSTWRLKPVIQQPWQQDSR